MTYPFCPECGLDWKDCKCSGKHLDDFTRKHLQAWADATLHDDERDELVQKMVAYIEHNPDVIERDFSWGQVRDIIERNEKLGVSV